MSNLNDLTISIVSHSHGKLLDSLLDDLCVSGALERSRVIVTFNIDDPEFPFEKWRLKKIIWIRNTAPKGFGENHNFALNGASTKWLLVLNPDIRLFDTVLRDMLSTLPDSSDIGVIAPRIVSLSGSIEDSVRDNITPISLLIRTLGRLVYKNSHSFCSQNISGDWFAGMFLLIPSQVFHAVNGFDERYFLYCEDCDLCIRISLLGKRLVLDERYVVVHDAQRKSRQNPVYFWWHLHSLFKLWLTKSWWFYTFKCIAGNSLGVERFPSSLMRYK